MLQMSLQRSYKAKASKKKFFLLINFFIKLSSKNLIKSYFLIFDINQNFRNFLKFVFFAIIIFI